MILIFIISVISVIILITSACMSLLCLKITTMNMTMLAMLTAMNMAMLTRLFTGVYTYHQFDNWIASAGMDNMIIWMMIG